MFFFSSFRGRRRRKKYMTVWKTILLSLICLPAAVPVYELTNAWQLHSAIPQLRWLQLRGQRNDFDFAGCKTLALRGGMPAPHYVPRGTPQTDEEKRKIVREYELDLNRCAEDLKKRYPTAALSLAVNGTVLENAPLCVTRQDFERHGIEYEAPQFLPLAGVNNSKVKIMAGKEVQELVERETREHGNIFGQNMSDPLIQAVHHMPGYRPEGKHFLGMEYNDTWCTEDEAMLEDWLSLHSDPLRNRTYRDDWEHYMQLIEEGVLPAESDNLGLLDYYEYLQALNKELLEAAEFGNITGMRRLIALGADVNYREIDPDFGYSPLIMAASTGEIKAMRLLLSLGAHVQDRSTYNGTALHYAASNGRLEACALLLQPPHNADPNAFAEWGGTPLEWAIERFPIPGVKEVIRLLEPLTDIEAQLGRHHPRPWLGPRDSQDWYWELVNASGVKLSEHGWWGRNAHRFPEEAGESGEQQLDYWEKRAAAKAWQEEV